MTSARKSVLITGANRGIGLGLTAYFLKEGHNVYAAARNPDGARELWEAQRDYPDRCHILELDVTQDADVARVSRELANTKLDTLINNAGILPQESAPWSDVTPEAMLNAYRVNVVGPLRVIQALWPALDKSSQPLIANISTRVASIADNQSGGMHAYRSSKSALNMLTKCLSLDLSRAICVALHPGWVATGMGGPKAPTTVDDSVAGLYSVMQKLTPRDTGRFLDFRGQELPW